MEKFIIDDRIFSVKFSCDVSKCFGACCTLKGAGGAPLLDEEVPKIKKVLKTVSKHLSERHKDVIEVEGFLEGEKGDYSVKSVDDSECVFAFYEDGIARCAFQKAHVENEIDFPKPISCHLYPIRVKYLKNGTEAWNYSRWHICNPACKLGKKLKVPLYQFLKRAIVRAKGRKFYKQLEACAAGVD